MKYSENEIKLFKKFFKEFSREDWSILLMLLHLDRDKCAKHWYKKMKELNKICYDQNIGKENDEK